MWSDRKYNSYDEKTVNMAGPQQNNMLLLLSYKIDFEKIKWEYQYSILVKAINTDARPL